MNSPETPLDLLKRGNAVRYRQEDWVVTDKTAYKVSANYQEIQWTLANRQRDVLYLLRADEVKDGSTHSSWVITRQIKIADISYDDGQGKVKLLAGDEFLSVPPKSMIYQNVSFDLDGENTGKAKDDDGRMVTKITWDYYDPSRKRNLAIEIWKESDRDYPEAYDGLVVEPSEFEVHPYHVASRLARAHFQWKDLSATGSTYFFLLFLFPCMGVPFDCCVAASIPVALIVFFHARRSRFWIVISAFVWATIALVIMLLGSRATYWGISTLAIIAATIIPRFVVSRYPVAQEEDNPMIAVTGLLPALWVYSFWMYYKFAPGPHDFVQICTAAALPLLPALICFLSNHFLDLSYGKSQA